MTNTTPSSVLLDNGSHLLKLDKTAEVKMFKKGVPLGTPQYTYTAQEDRAYQKARAGLNNDLAYANK